VFSDADGEEISRANTYVPVISHGEETPIIHNVTLSVGSTFEDGGQYLLDDSDLHVSVVAGLNFGELLPVEISTIFSFPWGVPFYGFALGTPAFGRFGSGQGVMTVPLSFDNHAFFDVAGSIRVELYDDGGSVLGEAGTLVDVPQGSSYDESAVFSVPLDVVSLSAARNGRFDVYFDTGVLNMVLWWFLMVEEKKKSGNLVRAVSFRVAKAAVKAILVYLIYFLLVPLLAPLFELIPGFMESIEVLVVVYIVLMLICDLTAKTVFQYFFSTARALFFMAYLMFSMGDGVFNTSYENFSLTVNLTLFYTVAVLLSLLGFARTILQAINFMH
jgi:hypothetical protein